MARRPEHRVAFADVFDDETRAHDDVFHRAAAIGETDHVLDIGCGTGRSTRRAAQAASEGTVLGVDVSPAAIEHARAVTAGERLSNVMYEVADAQVHPLPSERFDVCISSFGTMFFADPPAAFRNIARSVRADGRLVLLVWQTRADNEWANAIGAALGHAFDPQPFSLGNPAVVADALDGFTDLDFLDVAAPVRYGPDAPTAYEFVRGFTHVRTTFDRFDPGTARAAEGRLRDVISEHATPGGVQFESRAWVITARRR